MSSSIATPAVVIAGAQLFLKHVCVCVLRWGGGGGIGQTVTGVAVTPDGARIVSCSSDRTLRLWDAASGEVRCPFEQRRRLNARALGRAVQVLAEASRHRAEITCLALGGDGVTLASSDASGAVEVWALCPREGGGGGACSRAAAIAHRASLPGHNGVCHGVALDARGRVAASAGRGLVRLWDVATRCAGHVLRGHAGDVCCVAVARAGDLVASGGADRKVILWAPASGARLRVLYGGNEGIRCVAFSPDGCVVASGAKDNTLAVSDTATGELLETLVGHGCWVSCVAFSADGARLASGGGDGVARVWDWATGACVHALSELSAARLWLRAIAFTPDGRGLVTGAGDCTVRLWVVPGGGGVGGGRGGGGGGGRGGGGGGGGGDGRPGGAASGSVGEVAAAVPSPNGRRLACACGCVRAPLRVSREWHDSATDAHPTRAATAVFACATRPAAAPFRCACGPCDPCATVADLGTRPQLEMCGHVGGVLAVAWSPDGDRLVSADWRSAGGVLVWCAADGRVEAALHTSCRAVALAWAPARDPKRKLVAGGMCVARTCVGRGGAASN